MASNRHLGRIVALQTLYELDFRSDVGDKTLDKPQVIARNIQRYSEIVEDKYFIEELVGGVLKLQSELDDLIQPIAPDWPLSQIARIDKILLRMGVYELKYSTSKVPAKVVVNEAVELAKDFGAENSSKFVNGVLGTYLKQTDPEASAKSHDEKKAKVSKKK